MPDTPPAEPETAPPTDDRNLIRFVATLVIFAWILRSFIVAPFSIPSGSMQPTMAIGDYLFVSKWPYGFSRYSFPLQIPSFEGRVLGRLPDRGDVVIFKRPDASRRRIGSSGSSACPAIPCRSAAGSVFLNGRRDPLASRLPR